MTTAPAARRAINVFVLGSCVSRDAFSLGDVDVHLSGYLARTSLASAFHPWRAPARVARLAAGIGSSFQRRMVLTDLNKRASQVLREASFDVLLLDLIDERFNLVCRKNDTRKLSWYTLSAELSRIHDGEGRLMLPASDDRWEGWKRGVTHLLEVVPPAKIILNRALWAERATTGERLEGAWPVGDNNALLTRMYDHIESADGVRSISYPDGVLADPGHRWGLAPFHYHERAYRHMLGGLKRLLGNGIEAGG